MLKKIQLSKLFFTKFFFFINKKIYFKITQLRENYRELLELILVLNISITNFVYDI